MHAPIRKLGKTGCENAEDLDDMIAAYFGKKLAWGIGHFRGHIDYVLKLIDETINKGADINHIYRGRTPLQTAIKLQEDPVIFHRLLEYGADVNLKDRNGEIALSKSLQQIPGLFGMILKRTDPSLITPELVEALYLNGAGAIVLSSSKGGELSYESETIKNGFFTEAIIQALGDKAADKNNDGMVSTDELRQYVAENVAQVTNDMQHPTVDRDNIYVKFGFPISLYRSSLLSVLIVF